MTKEELLKGDGELSVTITLDDDTDVECDVVTVVTANEKDYVVLLPQKGPDAENGSVWIYRLKITDGAEPDLEYIESDEEYEAAADAFDEYLDSAEFDELVEESEEDRK